MDTMIHHMPAMGEHSACMAGPGMKSINLALQGGGAHGAFTWGVLDALLEDAEWSFLQELHELGRAVARQWLAENYDMVGVHATVDLRAAYA